MTGALKKPLFFERMSTGDKIFQICVYIYLLIAFLIVIFPIMFIVSSSFSTVEAVFAGRVYLLPVGFNIDAYLAVFTSKNLMTGFRNSIIYTVGGTITSIVVTTMLAYPLSKKDLVGRNAVTAFYAFTLLFGGGLIPTYLNIQRLGLINNRLVMIIPMGVSVIHMAIMRTYFTSNIPADLYEAAQLDGCRDVMFLFKVVIPLSGPIFAVLCLYNAVGSWNSFFFPMIYLNDKEKWPLQVFLREILILAQGDSDMSRAVGDDRFRFGMRDVIKFSVIVVSSAPMMIIYPFIQKYFVKGVMIGAIKG